MELSDALQTLKAPGRNDIPDCSREDLPALCVKLGYRVGVEIGVREAVFTESFAKAGLQIIGVDPWMPGETWLCSMRRRRSTSRARQDEVYGIAQQRLASYPQARLIRATSMDAVKEFPYGSLDFVYIDGNHGFKCVAEDLWEWTNRLKPGGLMSGHDYDAIAPGLPRDPMTCHVRYVVDAWVAACKITPWYVLGRRGRGGRERCDKWRSWMWINA